MSLLNFYPRPPRGGRRDRDAGEPDGAPISIHALREEGDQRWQCAALPTLNFYPRPPRGGRPGQTRHSAWRGYFYPRPPRGGRHLWYRVQEAMRIFLSTPSARRATVCLGEVVAAIVISIHALREEGDFPPVLLRGIYRDFYPRPPRGGRRADCSRSRRQAGISIHALREEGDSALWTLFRRPSNFYPRPPRGGRPPNGHSPSCTGTISIHALREEGDRTV